jgi:tetratricopeptide (TPR) repeat protein
VKLRPFQKAIVLAALVLLGRGVSAETCKIEKKAELSLGYTYGLATVEAKINGTNVIMGLDTGAQSVVTPQIAGELNLIPGLRRTLARGATAVTIADQVILRDFEFAGEHYKWKAVTKINLPSPKVPDLRAKPAVGLIGMDVLGSYDLAFDFPHRRLTLYTVKNCAALPPPDFADLRIVPFTFNAHRNIFFPVELDGNKVTALLDTGAVGHLITRTGIKKTGVTEAMLKGDPESESIGIGNISLKHPLHTFGRLSIGGVGISNARFGVLIKSQIGADAVVGQLYLFTRRIWISNATRRLYIENKLPVLAYTGQTPGLPTLASPAGVPKPQITLEEVCKGSAALRLKEFCEKGAEVPAAALGSPLPVPAVPRMSAGPAPSAAARGPVPALAAARVLAGPAGSAAMLAPPEISQPKGAAVSAPPPYRPEPHYRDPHAIGSGVIGTGVVGISPACGLAMGLPDGAAALVRGFSTGSTGEKAGLRRGDIIRALDGQPLTAVSSFLEAIGKKSPGQTVKLTVWRDNTESTIEAEIADSSHPPADMLSPVGRAVYQVEAGKAVLDLLPGAGCEQERAMSLIFLGGAYNRGAVASSTPNDHEQAIKYLEEGLGRLDPAKFRANWANGYTALGTAYRLRSAGDKSANIQKSIKAYEEATSIQNEYVTRNERGYALMGLGLALLKRGAPARSEDIERAIGCFKLAAEAFDSKVSLTDLVALQRARGEAFSNRREGQREQNIGEAIAALEIALAALGPIETGAAERGAVLARLVELKAQRLAPAAEK